MISTDGYVRNMIGYSEGAEIYPNPNAVASDWVVNSGESTVADGSLRIVSTDGSWSSVKSAIRIDEDSNYMALVEYEIIDNSVIGSGIKLSFNGSSINNYLETSIGRHYIAVLVEASSTGEMIIGRTSDAVDFTVSFVSIKKLTSTYPIDNFTASCRDEAKNLQTGLQTCFWKRDVLGVPVGSSFGELTFHSVDDSAVTKNVSMANVAAIEYVYVNSIDKYKYNRVFSLYRDDGTLVLETQRLGTNDQLCLKVNTQNAGNYISLLPITHVVYEFNIPDNTVSIFSNGVKVGDTVSITDHIILDPATLYLGNSNYLTRGITGAFRLFNIHTTPQDPAKLYADVLKRGDLS